MRPKFSAPSLLAFVAASSVVLAAGGCASKEERIAARRWETSDERATREVFRSDWLLPSVSREDRDFFYGSFLKNSSY